MNKAIVAGIVLGGCAVFACAQDAAASALGHGASAAGCTACAPGAASSGAGTATASDADAAGPRAPASGESMGGYDVDVFAGQPSPNGGGERADPPRRIYGRIDAIGTRPGEGGFTLGRQGNFEHLIEADVGDALRADRAGNPAYPNGPRIDTAVRYAGSVNERVSGGSSFTVDGVGGDPVADRAWGLSVGYDYGALSLRASHQNLHVAQIHMYDRAGNTMEAKNSIIAANLRTRWGTAYAAYSANRGWGSSPLYNPDNPYGAGVASTSSTDSRDTLMGVAVPLTGATTFLASMIHRNDRDLANRDANMVAVGASYVLSHRTDFYAAFTRTVSTNGAGILIGGAAAGGSSAINVGMRHAF